MHFICSIKFLNLAHLGYFITSDHLLHRSWLSSTVPIIISGHVPSCLHASTAQLSQSISVQWSLRDSCNCCARTTLAYWASSTYELTVPNHRPHKSHYLGFGAIWHSCRNLNIYSSTSSVKATIGRSYSERPWRYRPRFIHCNIPPFRVVATPAGHTRLPQRHEFLQYRSADILRSPLSTRPIPSYYTTTNVLWFSYIVDAYKSQWYI